MTLYQLAQRFIGEVREVPGAGADPFIVWCHAATTLRATSDEVPWCSSFLNRLAWLLRLPRSKDARARSWLTVGVPMSLGAAQPGGNDVVILKRGEGVQPGPEVIAAPGHVIVFGGLSDNDVLGVSGNMQNGVTVDRFPRVDVLGVRRLV